jgi:hypothetical protein
MPESKMMTGICCCAARSTTGTIASVRRGERNAIHALVDKILDDSDLAAIVGFERRTVP